MRSSMWWTLFFAIVVVGTHAQNLGIGEWKLRDPTATIEGFNALRDSSVRAMRREADAGFMGYQDYTIVRDAAGQPVTEPTILALVQWTSAEASETVTSRLASEPGRFLDAYLAVEITSSHDYNGPDAGVLEDLNAPFQALGMMVHNLTAIADDATFTQAHEEFLEDLLLQTGVLKVLRLPNPEDGITISLVVYKSLDTYDTLSADDYFTNSTFLADYPPSYSVVGLDTDVGVEGTLNYYIGLTVWTVMQGTVDEFRPLRDGAIEALRRRESLGFLGYQDYTLDSNLTTFDTPTIIAMSQYVDADAESAVTADAVAKDPMFLEAFQNTAQVVGYDVTDPTGELKVEDLNEPFQTISYTAFNFTNFENFDFETYSKLRDDFLAALEAQNGVLKVWYLVGTVEPIEVLFAVLTGVPATSDLLASGFFQTNPAASAFLTTYPPDSTYTGVDTDELQEGALSPTASPTAAPGANTPTADTPTADTPTADTPTADTPTADSSTSGVDVSPLSFALVVSALVSVISSMSLY